MRACFWTSLGAFIHSSHWQWHVARRLVAVLVVVLIGSLDPIGLQAVSDARSRDAMYRISAPFYPDTARDRIALVLIDSPTLKSGVMDWPPKFDQYELLLTAIAALEPKAVFLDLLFLDRRGSQWDIDHFADRIADLTETVPVFLPTAQEVTPADGACVPPHEEVLPELARVGSRVDGSGGAPFARFRGFGESYYPVYGHCGARVLPSAAAAMLLVGREGSSHAETAASMDEPMSIRWGDGASPFTLRHQVRDDHSAPCQAAPEGWLGRLRRMLDRLGEAVFAGWVGKDEDRPCLYHPHLSAVDLIGLYREASGEGEPPNSAALTLAELKGAYVLVSANVLAVGDKVQTPTHGQVPGVAAHAMALDNLLTLGADYVHAPPAFKELDANDLIQLAVVVFLFHVEYLVQTRWHAVRARLRPVMRWLLVGVAALAGALIIFGTSLTVFLWLRWEPSNWLGLLMAYFAFLGAMAWSHLESLTAPPPEPCAECAKRPTP